MTNSFFVQYNNFMPKTKETKDLENALDMQSREKREYGCEEVTIGFKKNGHGDEIVDYMSMDASAVFKCYEIKVTLTDLKTENKKSFYGDYNYLVVSESLYVQNPVWDNYIPPYAGILCGNALTVKRTAKKRTITTETREMLKDSLLRSIYWKMENYKDAEDLENLRKLKKQLADQEETAASQALTQERILWTYQDYEHYYRCNHQDPSFNIENAAKQQRLETELRRKGKFTWQEKNGTFVCPACGRSVLKKDDKMPLLSDFCPFCGADLRKIEKQ